MSQKAIKKRTKDSVKHAVHIPVEPLGGSSRRQPGSLPQKSFPMNKFIALPNGLRPKSSQNVGDESTRRNIPFKAVAIPSGTSLNDSRASVYVIPSPQAHSSSVPSEAYITGNSPDHTLHNNIALSSLHTNVNSSVRSSRPGKPSATSTPLVDRRTEKRAYSSAQNSPKASTLHGRVNNDSFGSEGNRKRRYQKRSHSAPPGNARSRLQDTEYVIRKWSENDHIPGLIHKVSDDTDDTDFLSITNENWSSAKVGIYPNGVIRTVYRSNSVNSGQSVNSINTHSIGSSRSISELEFTDVCKVNDNNVELNKVLVHSADFTRSDLYADESTCANVTDNNSINKWENIPDLECTKSIKSAAQLHGGHKIVRSLSDFNLEKINMGERTRRISHGSSSTRSKSYAVSGVPQSGIVISMPGGERMFVKDSHHNMVGAPAPSYGHEFYTVGRQQGTLMQSKMKFSSMPTLLDSKGDKKLMKLLKKQEKEEKKRKEKEEKKRAKEEKKRLKMEKKLKTKTLPRNFAYTNGHILSPTLDNVYRRPMLTLSAVPIDFEDGQQSTMSSQTPAPKLAPPPLPGPSQRTMSLYASAPDLLRLEQVYGATLRSHNDKSRSTIQRFVYYNFIVISQFQIFYRKSNNISYQLFSLIL